MEVALISTTKSRSRVETGRMFKVVMHNDDTTPMEVVIIILLSVFDKCYDDAVQLMLSAHLTGGTVVGIYPKKLATFKKEKAIRMAREAGYSDFSITLEEVKNEG